MRNHRLHLLALALMVAFSVLAAGCGGDDDDEGAATGATTGGADTGAAQEDVSGEVSVMSTWSGPEQESFQAVIDGFTELYPNVEVSYDSAGDALPTVLSTAVEGGSPPDVAVVPQPGLVQQYVERGALQPLDFAQDTIAENFAESVIEVGTFEDQLYAVLFKASNKSTYWYNVQAFQDAGVEPTEDWEEFLANAETIKASGLPAYSIGGAEGWTLTDLFENIYLRTAGADMYDQLSRHEIPWTDQSVKDALTEMAKIVGDVDNIVGGTQGALQSDFTTSVSNVFTANPKGAEVIEGDFVPGVVESPLEPETGYNVSVFPSINDSPPSIVASGDLAVMFERLARGGSVRRIPRHTGSGGHLGRPRRVLVGEPESRPERVPRHDHGDDRGRGRRGRAVPLRPLGPAAVGVRRHGGPGPLEALPGLRRESGRRRRDRAADGGGGRRGVRQLGSQGR